MPKRTLCIALLLIFLLFSSCGEQASVTDEPSASPSPAVASEMPAQTQAPPEHTAAPLSDGVLLPNGMPVIPVSGEQEKVSRYYSETAAELRPRPDYGRLYPFVGRAVPGMWGESNYLYGLCDAQGRIVCDAVYNNIETLEKEGDSLYLLQKYYVAEIKRYEKDQYPEVVLGMDFTYAALDGSWVKTFQNGVLFSPEAGYEDGYIYDLPKAENEYIPIYDGNGWGAMDYCGNIVYPCRERFPVEFCEGLAAVISGDGTEYSYINILGEQVLGPYTFGVPIEEGESWRYRANRLFFSNGLARYCENNLWGFIDLAGNIVIEPQYYIVSGCLGEYIHTSDENWKETIIDRNGNLAPPDVSSGRTIGDGWYYTYIASTETAELTKGDKKILLASNESVQALEGGKFAVSFWRETAGEGSNFWYIIDDEGRTICPEREGWAWADGKEFLGVRRPENGNRLEAYDFYGNPILSGSYDALEKYGENYCAVSGYYGGAVDSAGRWLIKVRLDIED